MSALDIKCDDCGSLLPETTLLYCYSCDATTCGVCFLEKHSEKQSHDIAKLLMAADNRLCKMQNGLPGLLERYTTFDSVMVKLTGLEHLANEVKEIAASFAETNSEQRLGQLKESLANDGQSSKSVEVASELFKSATGVISTAEKSIKEILQSSKEAIDVALACMSIEEKTGGNLNDSGKSVLIIGGSVGGHRLSSIEVYHMPEEISKRITLPDMDMSRVLSEKDAEIRGAVGWNGKIYLYLWVYSEKEDELYAYILSSTDCLSTPGWTVSPPAPEPLAEVSLNCIDGNIYFLGTSVGQGRSAQAFSISGQNWFRMSRPKTATGGTVVSSRGSLYVSGGVSMKDAKIPHERFNPVNGNWESVASLSCPKCSHVAAALDDYIYICGGIHYPSNSPFGSITAHCEKYSIVNDKWEQIASMNAARQGFALAVIRGKLYAFGGCSRDGTQLSSVEIYDPNIDKWTIAPKAMKMPRSGHSVICMDL